MSNYKSEFIKEIYSRGFIHQATDLSIIDKRLLKSNITAYIGFHATSDSLHVGSLIPLMLLRWFQYYGNKPIALIGGGTTMVGDPSGKDETRNILKISENLLTSFWSQIGKRRTIINRANSCFEHQIKWSWLCQICRFTFRTSIIS